MPIRLLIADDHEVVRCGLRRWLADSEVEVVGEAANGDQVLELALRLDLDLVLLDVRMPEEDVLRRLKGLRDAMPNLPVLMLSDCGDSDLIASSMDLGAGGYLLKSGSREELLTAIGMVAAGHKMSTSGRLRRAKGASASPRGPAYVEFPLTKREHQVLRYLAHALTNNEIAEHLSISYDTVKEHVQHILCKLGCTDRTQAAIWAVRNEMG